MYYLGLITYRRETIFVQLSTNIQQLEQAIIEHLNKEFKGPDIEGLTEFDDIIYEYCEHYDMGIEILDVEKPQE